MNFFKLKLKENIRWIILPVVIIGVYSYHLFYVPHRNLLNGFVVVGEFNCPPDHPIKAYLATMIYHMPGDPYYSRTSASKGECFDTSDNAVLQGFRASYGTPITAVMASSTAAVYNGGYKPDGSYCMFGYDPDEKECCDDSDYTCEVRDMAPTGATALCMDGTYGTGKKSIDNCSQHGGVNTDSQYNPFVF